MTDARSPEPRVIVFGEVLYDRFPDGSEVLGGAPFNVAWNLRGLGLYPLFISRVGDDELGDRVFAAMTGWGMNTSGLQRDAGHPTGTVEVELAAGEPTFDIVDERAYDFIEWEAIPPVSSPALLYHGSLALRNPVSREAAEWLVRTHCPPVFLDVNLRPPWWERAAVERLLAGAGEVKMNEEELAELVPTTGDMDDRSAQCLSRFDLERLWVTRGDKGAVAYTADGSRSAMRPTVGNTVVDTVGAGDAFSSVVILGRLEGWSIEDTLTRAQELASAVVGRRGATVEDASFYVDFRRSWSRE